MYKEQSNFKIKFTKFKMSTMSLFINLFENCNYMYMICVESDEEHLSGNHFPFSITEISQF